LEILLSDNLKTTTFCSDSLGELTVPYLNWSKPPRKRVGENKERNRKNRRKKEGEKRGKKRREGTKKE